MLRLLKTLLTAKHVVAWLMQRSIACRTDTEGPLCDMQTVTDMVQHNSALLKELGEGRRAVKELKGFLQREREQAKAVQLEYDQFRHQVMFSSTSQAADRS